MCTRNLFPPRQIASSPVKDLAFTYGSVLLPGVSKLSEVNWDLTAMFAWRNWVYYDIGGVWKFGADDLAKYDKLASQSVSFGELCTCTDTAVCFKAGHGGVHFQHPQGITFPHGFQSKQDLSQHLWNSGSTSTFSGLLYPPGTVTFPLTKVTSRLPACPQLSVSPYSSAVHKAMKVNPGTVEEVIRTNNELNALQSN